MSEQSEEIRRAREEIEELEASRLRLSEAVMRGVHEARNEDRQLERRLRDLSRLIMWYERDKEEARRGEAERRGETERRGEELKEAWRQHHPMQEERGRNRPKKGGCS